MRILTENLLNSLSKASYAPFLVEKGVGYDLNFFVFVCSCIFTYTGHRYDDGRKDLQKSLSQQFLEAVEAVNNAVFDNHKTNKSVNGDAMALEVEKPDLVYIDPPYYSPLSDNEYVRRYHFIEGLARDWKGVEIQ